MTWRKMVERDEVVAPQVVERLQDHLLLDIAHRLGRVALDALGVGLVGGLVQALGHFLVGDAFFLRPGVDRQVEVELGGDLFLEAGDVPGFRIGVGRNVAGDEVVDDVGAHVGDGRLEQLLRHHLAPVLEDDLALVVHHVVELENVLADVEVARLDLLLRLLQRLVDPRDGRSPRRPSGPSRFSIASMRSEPKMRIRSSCSDRKNLERPGSPWRPERPRNWLSMRRLSCRSVPMM